MSAKKKSWSDLTKELDEIGRKWGLAFTIANDLDARGRRRIWHTPEEREVRLLFTDWNANGERHQYQAHVRVADNAVENLRLIVVALEMMRLAEHRGVAKIIAMLYRQMYPVDTPRQESPPAQIPPHYAALHLNTGAPLEVAEAAYKALARKHHPDAGGDTVQMQRLNAAIEHIRKEKA